MCKPSFPLRAPRACLFGLAIFAALLAGVTAPSPGGLPATRPAAAAPALDQPIKWLRPMPKPVPDEPDIVTDEQVGNAIQHAVDYLISGLFKRGQPLRLQNAQTYDSRRVQATSAPDYAQALVKNIVFWTLDGQKEQ